MRALFMFLAIVAMAIPAAAQQPAANKPATAKASKPSATATAPVNLNTATQAQLEALPGIGPSLAQAIIQERDREGGFHSVEDLRRVRGIGDVRFAQLRPLVTL